VQVSEHLIRQLLQHLLSQVAFLSALIEADKLDYVSFSSLSIVAKPLVVAVKLLHHREVGVSDANDDH